VRTASTRPMVIPLRSGRQNHPLVSVSLVADMVGILRCCGATLAPSPPQPRFGRLSRSSGTYAWEPRFKAERIVVSRLCALIYFIVLVIVTPESASAQQSDGEDWRTYVASRSK
jgi:hypothetical protein